MKTLRIAALAVLLPVIQASFAEEGHEHHDHKHEYGHEHAEKIAGPNGGRVITVVEPHVEFFLMKDNKVQITSVDDHGKKLPLGDVVVSVMGGDRSKPTRLSFKKSGDVLISDQALPEGDMLPIVVTLQAKPDAKKVYERFKLNLADCPECDYLEYACTCDHEH